MLKVLTSAEEYMDFVHEMRKDPDFSDPMLKSEMQLRCNLLDAPGGRSCQLWGVFQEGRIAGLFAFLILEEEAYIEMLAGLSRVESAYQEMLSYLRTNYKGYTADFVYNPRNYLLHRLLLAEEAEIDAEQQKMVLKREVPYESGHQIELYSAPYREQYLSMHTDGGRYWTAERVMDAPGKFRIFLAIEGGEVAGYLDVTYTHDENEPYDLFVKEEYRRKGYGKALLAQAIAHNKPKGMMVLLDAGDRAAIGLYEALGFVRSEGENSVTARVLL